MKSFNKELDGLKAHVLRLGRLTQKQLDRALDAAEKLDIGLAALILEREPDANRMEHEVDQLAIRLLALRQPVANDLRAVISALRIANELERVCDYAADFAERFITLQTRDGEPIRALVNIGRFAVLMLEDAMQAYESGNVRQAEVVWSRDKELDKMYTELFRQLLGCMVKDAGRISMSTQMLFMARDIERVGDRATNIAENVWYLIRGTMPEETRPKADATRSILSPTS
jgi:phosphate transport system protein